MEKLSGIDPGSDDGISSRETVCGTCEDPQEDLPGIPIILAILISGLILIAGLVIVIGKLSS